MLKLTELRLGNLFEIEIQSSINKKIKKVKAIKEGQVLLDNTWYNLEKLLPIPLTSEILVKCGFTKFNWITETNVFQCNFFKCILDENGVQIFDDDLTNLKPLKYVHELQNLYFYLTEEELQANLDKVEKTEIFADKAKSKATFAILSGNA